MSSVVSFLINVNILSKEQNIIEMVYQIKYEWEIKDFKGFSEKKDSCIFSPVFVASPDEISHRWKVCFLWNLKYKDYYGVSLHLDDEPYQLPISSKIKFKVYDMKNNIISEGSVAACKNEPYKGWGFPIDRSICHFKSIKKISLDIELFREPLNNIQSTEPLNCSIDLPKKVHEKSENSEPIVHQLTKKLQEDLLKLYNSKKQTDLTIKCGNRNFDVHKIILDSRSPAFKPVFGKQLKCIEIENINPESMEVFLEFVYTGAIKITSTNMDDILELAEKYNFQELKKICSFEMITNIEVSTAVKFLIAADKYEMPEMKKNALRFIKENICDVVETDAWKSSMQLHPQLVMHLVTCIAKDLNV